MSKRATAVMAARRSRAAKRPASLKKRAKNLFAALVLTILTGLAIGAIYLLVLFVQTSKNLPSLAEIGNFKPSEGTRIYFADGALMAVVASENRRPVKLQEISQNLVDATIATEDSRFYEHRGIDLRGIARAAFRDISGGEAAEGASTITQQLARNINELGLTRRKKLSRKMAEAALAIRIEQTFDKNEILELYLNQIYYGSGAYGAEAAARTYFHKSAKKLTLAQAAWLAGLPQRPAYYSSLSHRDQSLRRRDVVLQRMVDTGKITQADAEAAKAAPLKPFKAEPTGTQIYAAPYAVNYVVRQLVAGYGTDAVYSGLSIYTTLDSRIQRLAEKTLADGIHHYGESANQGALVCIDNRNGYIRAMVGGLDYKRDQFNVAAQGIRQPGSSFKPIVYTSAIDTGRCDLETTYRDDPDFPGRRASNTWRPKNYSGKYSYRRMTVLDALRHSINTVAVKVAMDAGVNTVIDYAKRMGITTALAPYAPLALGASGVRPLDLCSAYTVFPNGGKRPLPMAITRINAPNGDLLDDRRPQIVDTGIKPTTIEMMNQALQEVVLHGTGTMAADVPNAHGKTGTTSDARDAWFAGYTPELTTVIWVAHENRIRNGRLNTKEPYLEMPGATGGHLCAPIWRDFMLKAVPIQVEVNKAWAAVPPGQSPPVPDEKKPKPEHPINTTKLPLGPPAPPDSQNAPGSDTAATPEAGPDGQPAPTADQGTGDELTPSTPPAGADPSDQGRTGLAPLLPSALRGGAAASPRMTEPSGRVAAPAPRAVDPRDEMVSVRLCADTMRRATRWCDATVTRTMRRRDIPGPCRLHRPPPGEE